MDLNLFRVFDAIYRAGSLTEAARDLHLSQPAVSQQMKNLEAALGTALVDHARRPMQLTPAGRSFLARTETVLVEALESRGIAVERGVQFLRFDKGASNNRDADGDYDFTYKLARSLCLLGAAAAEVVPVETIDTNFRDLEALRKRAIEVRRQGYRGMLAIHPAQVPVINEAFTPSDEEVAEAREIVDLFAANPGAGTIGWKGGMLDRPHLSRARQLLAQVEG